jgi:acetyl-CoA acetyltransferase
MDGTTAIVGIGQTEFSKRSGRSEIQLAAEASRSAIVDAGLAPADIDGMVSFSMDSNDEIQLMNNLGIPRLRWVARTSFGGGGASATVQLAVAAVAAGAANHVLVYRAFNERSGRRFGQPNEGLANERLNWYLPYGLDTPAKFYAMWYSRYMQRYGVTNEDLGRYVVVARRYAATNPAAWYFGKPITLEQHQESRWIAEPVLRLLDCCQESDGGVALIVSSVERARDLAQPEVVIAAAVQAHVGGDVMFPYYGPEIADFLEAEDCARQLWNRTGLQPADIDVAMLYENFSPVALMQLEAFGFCGKGEAKDFIADGQIDVGGATPVNTNGGLLGEGYIHGVNNILEAVRQIRGTAANQVSGAEHALASAGRSAVVLSRG